MSKRVRVIQPEKKEYYCNYLRQAYKNQHINSITVQEQLCIRLKKRESVLVLQSKMIIIDYFKDGVIYVVPFCWSKEEQSKKKVAEKRRIKNNDQIRPFILGQPNWDKKNLFTLLWRCVITVCTATLFSLHNE